MKEGERVTINVSNALDADSSIHWHGFILPSNMDGVPGLSFAGIRPDDTFRYEFELVQNGTYWYHSHSGLQEQTGVYGPIIIEPREEDPVKYDREYVIMLSDWTFEDPNKIFAKLKKQDDYYNRQRRTLSDYFRDVRERGQRETTADRRMWGNMRMAASDIADVTGTTYTYLLNGHDPASNWSGIFEPGQKIRLRIINGSAMTFFNFRIPGLEMSVVQTDGQNLQPVTVDELQIGVAETYDVVVQPKTHQAYTLFAEAMDRSGYARGTLLPEIGMTADVPKLRTRPLLATADMGMDHSGMGHAGMNHGEMQSMKPIEHRHKKGPGVANVVANPKNKLAEPGIGLRDVPHRVLTYADLKSLNQNADLREPERTLELHLTGNMERYMWSFDGEKYAEVKEPIEFHYGERLRLVLVNDTMMAHPIHLHGMFVELDNGNKSRNPRKHTIVVKPAERLAVNLTADAPGRWAFHCHMIYHMKGGMMREVAVADTPESVT
jgi:FtsP/CotA-like multicopper oxidase with cupredoxin domain